MIKLTLMLERITNPFVINYAIKNVGPVNEEWTNHSNFPVDGEVSYWKQKPYSNEYALLKIYLGLVEGYKLFDKKYVANLDTVFRWMHGLEKNQFVDLNSQTGRLPLFLEPKDKADLKKQLENLKQFPENESIANLVDFLTKKIGDLMMMGILDRDFDPSSSGYAVT